MVLRPQVNVTVREAITLAAQQGQIVTAIIGTAQWGAMNTLTSLGSFSQSLESFKDDISGTDLTLIKGLDLLYRNGSGPVFAVRIGDGSEAKSTVTLDSGTTPVIKFDATHEGTYGDNIGITVLTNGSNRDLQITDGITTEVHSNGGTGFSSNTEIVTAINKDSVLVSATELDPTLIDAVTQTFLTGGSNGTASLTDSDFTDALDNILQNEDFTILVIPSKTDDSFHSTIVGKLNTRATTEDKFSVFISGIALDETITTAKARIAAGQRLGIVAPSIKYTHRIDGDKINLDGSYLACAYAGGIASRSVEVSPTHKVISVDSLIVDSTTDKNFYNNLEQEQLLDTRIVPITNISGSIQASRGVTRESDKTSIFFEQNIVNIVDFVRTQVFNSTNGFIGDPNNERIRNAIAKAIDGILEQDKSDEVIVDFQSTEVTEGTDPTTVNVTMTLQPTFSINFITVTLNISRA